ncbi:MAG TPA: 50S ribosomal protein L5 [Elusimicrobia bacterium]|jgi:large subunit ribosomal protein L5|nr:50S ribosomal protein L5 [Elusimicrobiota bacterium]
MARLKEVYKKEIIPEMIKKFGYKNGFQVPLIERIVVNIGLSEAKDNPKALDNATQELTAITGQKPQICRAKKSIANFKLRQGMPIGLRVTLRGGRMYEFLDRLVNCAIPRIRDFRGLNPNSFDGQGNYNLGLTEQQIFPEIDISKSDKVRGMSITFVTTAKTNEEAKELLSYFGMPFQKK